MYVNHTEVHYPDTNGKEKVLILILASIGSVQNIVILFTILSSPKLRKKITNIFVINLLFAQLLVSTVTVPMYCFVPNHIIYPYITALTITAYILNLCTVTFERYLAICMPYRYSEKISFSKSLRYSVLCWITSIVIEILPIFWKDNPNAVKIHRAYLGVTLVVIFVVPLIFIWFVYAYIAHEIFKLSKASSHPQHIIVETSEMIISSETDQSTTQRNRSYWPHLSSKVSTRSSCISPRMKEFHLALVFLAAAVAYNITWVPCIWMVFLQVINRTDLEPPSLSKIHVYLLVINANIDPLIYGLFLKALRIRISLLFCIRPYRKLNKLITIKKH